MRYFYNIFIILGQQKLTMLTEIAQRHEHWITLTKQMGAKIYAEDIVQEAYIKLNTYINKGAVNEITIHGYFYFILRSVFIDVTRAKKRQKKVSIEEIGDITDDYCTKEMEAWHEVDQKIQKEMDRWNWYDKKLFQVYISTDYSQRQLAAETRISIGSIHHTLRRCGDRLKQAVGEDIQDIFNKDFELIQ